MRQRRRLWQRQRLQTMRQRQRQLAKQAQQKQWAKRKAAKQGRTIATLGIKQTANRCGKHRPFFFPLDCPNG
jgi:hypothetical protein